MFLTTMPTGSWMMWRAQRSPFALSTTSKAVCTIAHRPGAIPTITHTAIATSTIPSALRKGDPNRGPSRGTAVTTSTCDGMRPRILHQSPSYSQTAATLARMTTNGGNTIAMVHGNSSCGGARWCQRLRYSRANGWTPRTDSGADAAEDVDVELAHQERFQRTPQIPRAQVRPVIRDQHDVARIALRLDLVRTAPREDAALDPQTLLDDFELQQMRWFNRDDALGQIPSPVSAADRCANAGLVAFGSDRVGQHRAKQEGRAPWNFLIEQEVIPDLFRAAIEGNPCRDSFVHAFAREQPTQEPRRICPQARCRHRFSHRYFGIPANRHSMLQVEGSGG